MSEGGVKLVPLCRPNNFVFDGSSLTLNGNGNREDLEVCQEGLKLLQEILDPVVVICIVGPARTGKSFFLSQFLQGTSSFSIGHTTKSHTTGIWIAITPTIVERDGMKARVLLLDAEGLGASSTQDGTAGPKWDTKVFTVCSLISSVLIYNTKTPRADDLQRLGFISRFSKSVSLNTTTHMPQENQDMFKRHAASFVWLIRDALLSPEDDESDLEDEDENSESIVEADWDKFMNKHILRIRTVRSEHDSDSNDVIYALRNAFSSFRAVGLPPPSTKRKVCKDLNNPKYKGILKNFLSEVQTEADKMLSSARVKCVAGIPISGNRLAELLLKYIEAVNSGAEALPWENIWDAAVKTSLEETMQKTLTSFREKVSKLSLPYKETHLITRLKEITLLERNEFFEKTKSIESAFIDPYLSQLEDKMKQEVHRLEDKNKVMIMNFIEDQFDELTANLRFELKKLLNTPSAVYGDLLDARDKMISTYITEIAVFKSDYEVTERKDKIFEIVEQFGDLMLSEYAKELKEKYRVESDKRMNLPCPQKSLVDVYSKLMEELQIDLEVKSKGCHRKEQFYRHLEELNVQMLKMLSTKKEQNIREFENTLPDLSENIFESKDKNYLQRLMEARNDFVKNANAITDFRLNEKLTIQKERMEDQIRIASNNICDSVQKKAFQMFLKQTSVLTNLNIRDKNVSSKEKFVDTQTLLHRGVTNAERYMKDTCSAVDHQILEKFIGMLHEQIQERFTDIEDSYLNKYKMICTNLMEFLIRYYLDEKATHNNLHQKEDKIKQDYYQKVDGIIADKVFKSYHKEVVDRIKSIRYRQEKKVAEFLAVGVAYIALGPLAGALTQLAFYATE